MQNIVNFTNKFAEIVVNDPDAQARVAVNTVVSFISGKTLIKIICGYVLELPDHGYCMKARISYVLDSARCLY